MWKSLDEKWEVIPYDKEKRPRKVKGTNWVVGISLLVSISGIFIRSQMFSALVHSGQPIPKPMPWWYDGLPVATASLAAVICLGFAFLKWKKNDKELDLTLIFLTFLIFIYIGFLLKY